MSCVPQKSYQCPIDNDTPEGIVSFKHARIVRSFGITSFIVVLTVKQFTRLFEAQLDIPKKKPALPDNCEDIDFDDLPASEAVPLLLALVQRGWNKPRKDNVDKIQAYCRRGLESSALYDVVHLPEFTVFTLAPVHFAPDTANPKTGELSCDSVQVLLDGLTRGTGLKHLARAIKDGCDDEEIVLRIIPGLPLMAARQIFVDLNSTPIAVPFADIVEKDARRPAFRIAMEVSQLVPNTKARQAYMFVQQALLGEKGETANAEPPIEGDEEQEVKLTALSTVIESFKKAMGSRWGNEQHVLCSGYGLAAVGRLYYAAPTTFDKLMSERVARMCWDRDDARVLQAGLSEPGKTKTKNKVTSYPMIRKVAELVMSDDWKKLALKDEEYAALQAAASGDQAHAAQ